MSSNLNSFHKMCLKGDLPGLRACMERLSQESEEEQKIFCIAASVSALSYAAENGRLEVIDYLLTHQQYKQYFLPQTEKAFKTACAWQYLDCVKYFMVSPHLDYSKPNAPIITTDKREEDVNYQVKLAPKNIKALTTFFEKNNKEAVQFLFEDYSKNNGGPSLELCLFGFRHTLIYNQPELCAYILTQTPYELSIEEIENVLPIIVETESLDSLQFLFESAHPKLPSLLTDKNSPEVKKLYDLMLQNCIQMECVAVLKYLCEKTNLDYGWGKNVVELFGQAVDNCAEEAISYMLRVNLHNCLTSPGVKRLIETSDLEDKEEYLISMERVELEQHIKNNSVNTTKSLHKL